MITIIVGAQYGSEGKGKVASIIQHNYDCAIRSGSVNSGHTAWISGKKHVLRQLPVAAVVSSTCHMIIPVGAVIDLPVLLHEINTYSITPNRLIINPGATVITPDDHQWEVASHIDNFIGSVTTGCGYAHSKRVNRQALTRAQDIPEIREYLGNTMELVHTYKRVLIEGTQGFGLSNYHSPYYPYVTSRDTTAAGVCSEVGISPFDVSEVILVARLFPIRVAGNSGPLPNETTWDDIGVEPEYTSVTNKVRRVAYWHPDIVNQAVIANRPTKLILNHVDYLQDVFDENMLKLTMPIDQIGTSPTHTTIIR